MELVGPGVENIVLFLPLFRLAFPAGGNFPGSPAVPGGVVDFHPWLDIVHVHVKTDALSLVFHREALHFHTSGHQLVPLEQGRHPVEHVVLRLLDVIRRHVFKGEHSLHIQVSGAGDQIVLVGVFPCQLEADEMTPVVQIAAVHKVVFRGLPSRGVHLADAFPVLGGHQVLPDAGGGGAASAQGIQGTVFLEGLGRQLLRGKIRLVAVELHIGKSLVGGNFLQGDRCRR